MPMEENVAQADEPVVEMPMEENVAQADEPEAVALGEVDSDACEKETQSNGDDNSDASANIMSNFAKMFAKGREENRSDDNDVATIDGVGNISKTLEEFVKDAIAKVIGDEISRQWNNGADFRSIAEAEIKTQVRAWIDNNMENMIKEEMNRVIAKVGSQG